MPTPSTSEVSIVRVGDVYRSKDPREPDRKVVVLGKGLAPGQWRCARTVGGRITVISAATLDKRWELVEVRK